MATQLNIKDAETVRMGRTLAQKLGGSVTAVVRQAIEEKLDATLRAEAKAVDRRGFRNARRSAPALEAGN